MKAINPGHFLLTCRLDNWVHLLEENHFHIARDRLPQALYISATALALAPAAAAESLIYRKRIRETKIEKDRSSFSATGAAAQRICRTSSRATSSSAGSIP